jgi:deoxyribose-phosphate aldolase
VSQQALVEALVRAVLAQLKAGGAADDPCACHQVAGGCCPDRLGRFVGQGADRFGLTAAADLYPREIARKIDHTLLKPDASRAQIETLCAEAREHTFATVCINPCWVRLCADLLRGSATRVCTVVGFPLGATTPEVKAFETARVVADGACEVDMVLNVGALKSGDYRLVEHDIAAVVRAARAGGPDAGVVTKVILETSLLSDDEKVRACVLAKVAGADFVKTSTGFGPGGATVDDVALMRRVVGPDMGVKAAGGVRDLKSAQAMIEAGADRIGASAGVKIVQESRGAAPAPAAPASGY